MTDVVLAVNSGSSSLKFAAYSAEDDTSPPLIKAKSVASAGTRFSLHPMQQCN